MKFKLENVVSPLLSLVCLCVIVMGWYQVWEENIIEGHGLIKKNKGMSLKICYMPHVLEVPYKKDLVYFLLIVCLYP